MSLFVFPIKINRLQGVLVSSANFTPAAQKEAQ